MKKPKKLYTPRKNLSPPAISVIIPLYNAEEYVGECLDSILQQTFQNFEVIVVDDCSTDSSREIVESYIPKFNGRLKLSKTKKNSGSGGYVPRNIGFTLARGEYVFFVDADDFILLTALETLYNAAKEYDAEVVYSATHYQLKKQDLVRVLKDGKGKKFQEDGIEDTPTLIVDDPDKSLHTLIFEKGFTTPWTQFVRREFLIKNHITFPEIPKAGDYIWVINVYCHAKRFLRFTTPLYFYRIYNANSVSQRKAGVNELFDWVLAFGLFLKNVMALSEKIEVLKRNPAYSLEVAKRYFEWCLNRTNSARKNLTTSEIYEMLYREFGTRRDLANFAMPFLFSTIDAHRKKLEDSPIVSVIIPLYNSELYISKCLDSILAQTFQDFELIIVDDCSTDSSCKIIKRYIPKFNGRLKLLHMEKNTGSGALPRNKGLEFSRGKYVFNMDNDDILTKTALEELTTLAEEYNADVVYCEKFYEADPDGSNLRVQTIQKGDLVDKPTLESEDLNERVQAIIDDRYYVVPWTKLIRRDLLIEHKITFPGLKISDDNIWNQGLVFFSKRFLRVPNTVYIYRLTQTSILRKEKTPSYRMNFWLDPVLLGLKALDDLMNGHEFFLANPDQRYKILKKFVDVRFNRTLWSAQKLTEDEIYSTIKDEYGDKLGEYDVLIPALCAYVYDEKKAYTAVDNLREFVGYITSDKASQFFTARIDIKLMTPKGDFKILSVSDDNAEVKKPSWLQQGGIGYQIQSEVGKLEVVTKAASDGQLSFNLKGISVSDPNDKAKRIPHWIGYTKFVINEQTIFDKLTPAWHDKPYKHNMKVKADEEIRIQVEWSPNKNTVENPTEIVPPQTAPNKEKPLDAGKKSSAENKREEIAPVQPAPKEDFLLEEMVFDVDKKSPAEVEMQLPTTSQEQSIENYAPAIRIDPHYFDAVIGVKLMEKGKLKISSVSDNDAKITKPEWLQGNGIGYVINSCAGNLKFVAKPSVDGKIMLTLKGMNVPDPNDSDKRIPYWVDYNLLKINGQTILNSLMPTWCDKPYKYTVNVKAGEEIAVEVEWLPNN